MAPPAAAADPVATPFAPQQIRWLIFSTSLWKLYFVMIVY
jgi:hypothetical protein